MAQFPVVSNLSYRQLSNSTIDKEATIWFCQRYGLLSTTLMPIIEQYMLPGTTIISDLWKAYANVGNMGNQHLTVNHSVNFVDPLIMATTNHVERMKCEAKRRNKREASPWFGDLLVVVSGHCESSTYSKLIGVEIPLWFRNECVLDNDQWQTANTRPTRWTPTFVHNMQIFG